MCTLSLASNDEKDQHETGLRGWSGRTRTQKCLRAPSMSYVLEMARQLSPGWTNIRRQRPFAVDLPQAFVLSRKLSKCVSMKRACGREQQSGRDQPGQVRSVHSFSQTHTVWLISYSVPRRLLAYCLAHRHAGRGHADRTIREFNELQSKFPL
jgi:hypothetical protein